MQLIAIIVTYQRPTELGAAVDALRHQTTPPGRVVIVDNDPRPTSDRFAADPWIDYLESEENLGPAGGIAKGMSWVLTFADDDDWVVLIDDDDPPPSDTILERLLDGALAERPDGPVSAIGMVGTRFDLRRGCAERIPDEELSDALVDVDWIAGGQLPMYSVAALRRVGTFDATLFFGFEELEFGLRLRAAGERLVVPGPIARERREHHGRLGLGARVPSSGGVPWRRYYSTRNLILITRRHSTRRAAARAVLRSGLGGGLRSLLLLRRPDLAAATLRGAYDAIRNRSGRTVEPAALRSLGEAAE